MTTSTSRIDIVKRYLTALEAGAVGAELAAFFTDDVVQEEFPNRLLPGGARRDLAALLQGAERGQKVMRSQRFELLRAVEDGDSVALELQWAGTLAVQLGTLPIGGVMRARFAVFLEFRGDRIARQHNYDCFDPW
jgi:ketosteroid isomerase-like protein